jgi:hypothetical protein
VHEIPTTADFISQERRAYRVPENLKGEVDCQICKLLDMGFIRESNSPMASPVICVLKNKQPGQQSNEAYLCKLSICVQIYSARSDTITIHFWT